MELLDNAVRFDVGTKQFCGEMLGLVAWAYGDRGIISLSRSRARWRLYPLNSLLLDLRP
jgi:hypothetical protein